MRGLGESKKVPGEEKIYTAGEKEFIAEQERLKTGIPINKSLQEDIKIMRKELHLDKYEFNF
jgi:LDH2 family malate/lactate/ureidoglycolate dehydrogenase